MISNNQLKIYRSLKTKKYRKREGKFLIEGSNLCETALESNYSIEIIFMSRSFTEKSSNLSLLDLISEKNIPFEIVKEAVINSLSDSVSPQGIVAVVKMPDIQLKKFWDLNPQEVLILDRIADPGNLGTILRSAEWFGIKTVIYSSDSVDLYNGKVLRSSSGSVFQLPLILERLNLVDFVNQLIEKEYSIFIADPNAENSYLNTLFKRPFALIVGSERHGVRREILGGEKISIPKRGKAESLNVAIAASILLAEACKKRN